MKDLRLPIGFLIIYGCVLLFYCGSNIGLPRTLDSRNIGLVLNTNETLSRHGNADSTTILDNTTKSTRIYRNHSQVIAQAQDRLSIRNYQFHAGIKGAVLLGTVRGGLTNQRIKMKNAIYMLTTWKRPIILPNWVQSREKFIRQWRTGPWNKIPITKIYDMDYLVTCLRKLNIEAIYPCLPDKCLPGFDAPTMTTSEIQKRRNSSLPIVVGHFFELFKKLPPRESIFRHGIDACITWSSEVQRYGQKLIEYIKKLSKRADLSNVFGLHLRVEVDFAPYIASIYPQWKRNGTIVTDTVEKQIIDSAFYCFDLHLKHIDFSKSWVYIATGESINSSKLIPILKRFPNMITKKKLPQEFKKLGMDFLGAVDSFVLEQLSFFVGIYDSTFSTQVAENRRLKNLPSALYSLADPHNCSLLSIWENW